MGGQVADHDRDATALDRAATVGGQESGGNESGGDEGGALRAALGNVRLDGAIFLRAEYTEGWAYQSPAPAELATLLRPGRTKLILFHIVAAGSLWIALDDGLRYSAQRGDVIVLPYGTQHTMGGATGAACVPIANLLEPPPWTRLPVIRHGGGGMRTDVVCGYLDSDDPLFDPGLRALPPVFIVRPAGAAAGWVQASIAYALERSAAGTTAGSLAATRLPELLLGEILRIHLASAPGVDHGWLAALRDPVLAPVLALLHEAPGRTWTVAELAARAAVSRSLLDQRFRQVLGRSPIRYLTQWRMHIARELLATTNLTVAAIARKVGYESEEAFSRAFKRSQGQSPNPWRAARSAATR
jgi:AraC-like DNA-binding protein